MKDDDAVFARVSLDGAVIQTAHRIIGGSLLRLIQAFGQPSSWPSSQLEQHSCLFPVVRQRMGSCRS